MFAFKSKRLKLLIAILFGVLVIGCGTIFTLAKTGAINIKMFADEKALMYSATVNIMPAPGQASRGASVRVIASKKSATGEYAGATTGSTNADGSQSIFNNSLAAGNYKFYISDRQTCSYLVADIPSAGSISLIDSVCSNPPPVEEQYFSVSGKVLDESSGAAIGGIAVSAIGNANTLTRSDGSFLLSKIRFSSDLSSNYRLSFFDPSTSRPVKYGSDQKTLAELGLNVTIAANGTYAIVLPEYLRLTPGADLTLAGCVYAPDAGGNDQLVANAKIEILDAPSNRVIVSATSSSATSNEGTHYEFPYNFKTPKFSFNRSDISSLAIKISANGYNTLGPIALQNSDIIYPNTESLTLGQINLLKDFTLTKDEFTFFGYVKDEANQFVPGVVVTLKANGIVMGTATSGATALPPFSGVVSANYKISNVHRSTLNMIAELTLPPGYKTNQTRYSIVLSHEPLQSQDFRVITNKTTIYGTVKDDTGKILPNIKIFLKSNDAVIANGISRLANVAAPGIPEKHNYSILKVPKDNLTITAGLGGLPAGYKFNSVSFTLPADTTLYKKDFIVDKIRPMPARFTLIGSVKRSGSQLFINGVKVKMMALQSNKTVTTYDVVTSDATSDGIAFSHNFKIANFAKSDINKYVIILQDKKDGSGGYKAVEIPYTELKWVSDGVYRLPEVPTMKRLSTIEWGIYVAGNFLSDLLSKLNYRDLIRLFLI